MKRTNATFLISGANSGIGLALTEALATKGHTIYAGYRSENTLGDLIALQQKYGELVKTIQLDVTDSSHIDRVLNQFKCEHVSLDCVINNAGIAIAGPLEMIPDEQFETLWRVNVHGAWALTKAFIPLLRQSKGRIVNMSSVSGRVVFPFLASYCMSKHALEVMSDALRVELNSSGIDTVLIEPGPIATPIWSRTARSVNHMLNNKDEAAYQQYAKKLDGFEKAVADSENSAMPADIAAEKMAGWILKKKPKPRYMIMQGSKFRIHLLRLLPTRWRDQLLIKAVS